MKLKKIENYSSGYSGEELLKRCVVSAVGAAMLSGLAGCTIGGEEISGSSELDGSQTYVTESDHMQDDGNLAYDGKVAATSSDDEEPFMMDGDTLILSQDVDFE